jgi:hypothetical protein
VPVVGTDKSVEAPPGVSAAPRLFHGDVAIPETTLAGLIGFPERSVRRSGDIGSPQPPRRLYDHEVFRRPASRAIRRSPGGSRKLHRPLRVRAAVPSPVLPDRVAPPGVSRPFSDVSGGIHASRAIHGPEPSVLGVSHPLDGLLSLRPCGHARSAAAHGVLAREALSGMGPEVTLPRLLHPSVHSALQPRTLRNTRSKALRTRRHLSPSALVPRPWFQSPQAPFGAHDPRAVTGAFAPALPLPCLSPPRLGEP